MHSNRGAESRLALCETPVKKRRLTGKTHITGVELIPHHVSSGSTEIMEPRGERSGHYDVLGITRAAQAAEVRRAYRKEALKTHPDKGGDSESFFRVMSAFEVLSDEVKRTAYDADLARNGSSDGQCSQKSTDDSVIPEDHTKAVRCLARASLDLLLREIPDNWSSLLANLSPAVLQAICDFIHESQRKKNARYARGVNQDDFPREIAPPEDLPLGWKCLEHMYRSGKSIGLNYVRYISPSGEKFQSLKSIIKADAEASGRDGDLALEQLEQKRKKSCNQDNDMQRRPLQRCIYTVRNSDGIAKYWVNANWAYFRIYTKKTDSLEKAVDWHIALSNLKETAKLRIAGYNGEHMPPPMTVEELMMLYRAEPDLKLTFSSNFSKGDRHNIHTPTTEDLETALRNHRRMQTLLKGELSKQVILEEREKACAEVDAKHQELFEVARNLYDAGMGELARRRGSSAISAPSAPATLAVRGLASGSTQPIQGTERPQSGYSRRTSVQAALELQRALRLDTEAAIMLTQRLRQLPAPVIKRRLAALVIVDHSMAWPSTESGGSIVSSASGALAFAGGRSARPNRARSGRFSRAPPADPVGSEVSSGTAILALPDLVCALPDRMRSGRSTQARRSGALTLALAHPLGADDGLVPRGPPPCPRPLQTRRAASHFWEAWPLLNLPAGIAPGCWLTIFELCKFRCVCPGGTAAVDMEMWARFRDFTCTPDLFEPEPQRTRAGRPSVVTHSAADRLLIKFLAYARHSTLFERIDMGKVRMPALENRTLQAALGRMPHLAHVVLPMSGWGAYSARSRFIRALHPAVCYELVDATGSVHTSGRCGDNFHVRS